MVLVNMYVRRCGCHGDDGREGVSLEGRFSSRGFLKSCPLEIAGQKRFLFTSQIAHLTVLRDFFWVHNKRLQDLVFFFGSGSLRSVMCDLELGVFFFNP